MSDHPKPMIDGFGTRGKLWVGLLVALTAIGFIAWGYQISQGLIVTGMDNLFSWGLYIMLFVFFVGLSAGGLILSSVPKFFHSKRYESVAALGVLISFASIVVAGLMILPDIGRPERIHHFLTAPDFRSPMVWDFMVVMAYGTFCAAYLWLLTRRDLAAMGSRLALGVEATDSGRERDRKLGFWAAAIAIPLAIALHSVTGWIFALQIGRGDWFNPLVAPMFIMKALVSGLALVLVVAILADRFTRFRMPRDQVADLGKILWVVISIHIIYLVAAERLPHAWAGEFEFWAITSSFLIGDTVYFWLWTVVGGAIPLALLAVPSLRKRVWVVFVASLLAIVGILFEGIQLVFKGYDELNIGHSPGVTTGTGYEGIGSNIWMTAGAYTPTLVELIVSIGLIALGALIVTLGLRYLPIQSEEVRSRTDGISGGRAATDGGIDREEHDEQ